MLTLNVKIALNILLTPECVNFQVFVHLLFFMSINTIICTFLYNNQNHGCTILSYNRSMPISSCLNGPS